MITRKWRWRDLNAGQRTAFGLLGAIQLALLAAALIDLRGRPASEIVGGKRLWRALVFVNWMGPLAYFGVGRRRHPAAPAVTG
jgi:hypothetical protein